jgi:TFIIF-interacting CTD phosphatase-like protein
MPQNYKLQKENGIFIKNFYGEDKSDSALLDLIPILKEVCSNDNNDVRNELMKMKNEIFTKITTNLQ